MQMFFTHQLTDMKKIFLFVISLLLLHVMQCTATLINIFY